MTERETISREAADGETTIHIDVEGEDAYERAKAAVARETNGVDPSEVWRVQTTLHIEEGDGEPATSAEPAQEAEEPAAEPTPDGQAEDYDLPIEGPLAPFKTEGGVWACPMPAGLCTETFETAKAARAHLSGHARQGEYLGRDERREQEGAISRKQLTEDDRELGELTPGTIQHEVLTALSDHVGKATAKDLRTRVRDMDPNSVGPALSRLYEKRLADRERDGPSRPQGGKTFRYQVSKHGAVWLDEHGPYGVEEADA